jgi:hypothetical protein
MTHARTFTAAFLALSITAYSGAQTVRCTTWNLEWFPNGSAHDASPEEQNHRIMQAASVLKPLQPTSCYSKRYVIMTHVVVSGMLLNIKNYLKKAFEIDLNLRTAALEDEELRFCGSPFRAWLSLVERLVRDNRQAVFSNYSDRL